MSATATAEQILTTPAPAAPAAEPALPSANGKQAVLLPSPPMADRAAVQAYWQEHGCYVSRGLFNAAEVAALREDFDRAVQQLLNSGEEVNARWGGEETVRVGGHANTHVLHTHNLHTYSARWMAALTDKRLLDVVETMIGPDIIFHHSKLFQKPAETGAPFPTHQDWGYFPTVKNSIMAGVIHVSEADDEMGCLRLFPGSHQHGRMHEAMGQARTSFHERWPLELSVPVPCQPGDVVFFHGCTVHGSLPNTSNRVRKTVLGQYYSGTDCPENWGHPNAQWVLRGWNHFAKRSTAG